MPRSECFNTILRQRVIAIVRTHYSKDAEPTVWAVAQGGIKAIEISLTTPSALTVIKKIISNRKRNFFMGAGTVLDITTCKRLLEMGVDFVVSPVTDERIIRLCNRYKRLVVPGAFTPTEIWRAFDIGADLIKVFPLSSVGPKYIKDLKAPLPDIPLVAAGGVDRHNLKDYLAAGVSAVAIGTAVSDPQAIKKGNFSRITRNAGRFLNLSALK